MILQGKAIRQKTDNEDNGKVSTTQYQAPLDSIVMEHGLKLLLDDTMNIYAVNVVLYKAPIGFG